MDCKLSFKKDPSDGEPLLTLYVMDFDENISIIVRHVMMNDPFSSSPMRGDASLVVVLLVVLDALVVFFVFVDRGGGSVRKTPDEHVSSEDMVRQWHGLRRRGSICRT